MEIIAANWCECFDVKRKAQLESVDQKNLHEIAKKFNFLTKHSTSKYSVPDTCWLHENRNEFNSLKPISSLCFVWFNRNWMIRKHLARCIVVRSLRSDSAQSFVDSYLASNNKCQTAILRLVGLVACGNSRCTCSHSRIFELRWCSLFGLAQAKTVIQCVYAVATLFNLSFAFRYWY